jgi:hypothetical protein
MAWTQYLIHLLLFFKKKNSTSTYQFNEQQQFNIDFVTWLIEGIDDYSLKQKAAKP